MTKVELLHLKSILLTYRNSESCANLMDESDTEGGLAIIERELRLKQMEEVGPCKMIRSSEDDNDLKV